MPSPTAHLAQNGLTLLIVFPARMSVITNEVSVEITRLPVGLASVAGQTCFPLASMTLRIVRCGRSTPPLAIAP